MPGEGRESLPGRNEANRERRLVSCGNDPETPATLVPEADGDLRTSRGAFDRPDHLFEHGVEIGPLSKRVCRLEQ